MSQKIILVASGKGGVGKSTFALNFAAILSQIGHRVALVDADIYGPSLPVLLNLKEKPQVKNQKLLPLVKNGIKMMSVGFLIDEERAGVWRGSMINKILHQLLRSIDWVFDDEEVDYMVIDMPPGTGDIYLSLAQNFAVDGAVLISTPQKLAIADVRRSVDCFEKLGVKILALF